MYVILAECEEYAQLTFTTTFVHSLTLNTKPTALHTSKCNATTPLVVGGTKTKNGELPHMAAIGWKRQHGIEFRCGGTLISDRFVLTAAHCFPESDYPNIVRLGDQNLYSKNDGLNELDVSIKKHFINERYDSTRKVNDIALIELVRSVPFTDFIRPACLWQTAEISNDKVLAAGWGKIKGGVEEYGSDELLKVELDVVSNRVCKDSWKHAISSSQMCAGIPEGGKDTCGGDSGGPLMITTKENNCLFYIVGE